MGRKKEHTKKKEMRDAMQLMKIKYQTQQEVISSYSS